MLLVFLCFILLFFSCIKNSTIETKIHIIHLMYSICFLNLHCRQQNQSGIRYNRDCGMMWTGLRYIETIV